MTSAKSLPLFELPEWTPRIFAKCAMSCCSLETRKAALRWSFHLGKKALIVVLALWPAASEPLSCWRVPLLWRSRKSPPVYASVPIVPRMCDSEQTLSRPKAILKQLMHFVNADMLKVSEPL